MTRIERRRDPRLGIWLFLATTLLVLAALVVFTRYPALFNRGREYRASFTSVAGLNVGAEVRYGGLAVGTVTSMDFDPRDPTRIVVRFRVSRHTPVRVDTRASVTQIGLLGEQYLNLRPGRRDAPPLPAGGTLPSEATLNFQDALSRVAGFLDRADTILGGAERLSRGDLFTRLDRTLARVEVLVDRASTGSDRVFARVDTAGRQLESVLARTDRLITVLDTTVRTVGPGARQTSREALATLQELHVLVADLHDALQEGGGMQQLVRNLSITSDNLARLTTRLERDPTSVLKARAKPRKLAGPAIRE